MDYQAIDLAPFVNADDDIEVPGVEDRRGESVLRGLPFVFAERDGGTRVLRMEAGDSVTVPVESRAAPVRTVTFAHRTRDSVAASFAPVGRKNALYTFAFSDGATVRVPIREGFEVAVCPGDWGHRPSLAVPDQSDSLPDRERGAFEDTGFRQTEVVEAGRWGVWVGAGGWRYYLWSWVNPRPEHDLVRIEIEAGEALVEVGGLCLGCADEHPLRPEPARAVVADAPADYRGDGSDLALEVDRGTAGYTTPLVRQPEAGDPFSAWGDASGASIGDTVRLPDAGGTVAVEATAASIFPMFRLELVHSRSSRSRMHVAACHSHAWAPASGASNGRASLTGNRSGGPARPGPEQRPPARPELLRLAIRSDVRAVTVIAERVFELPEPRSPSARGTPSMSRRHAAGTASARELLFTLLGEFVLTEGGRAWTSAVIAAFARLGVEEKATRQALMRTAAAGWLTAEKSGRRTRWRLTANASKLLTEGAERIYSFTGAAENWDGRWLVVSARIPESDRSIRHAVGRKLSWAGFGSIAPGLWVSPHVERETEAALVLRDTGITDAHVFAATRRGLADVREMIRTAWDLTAVEEQYEQFLADFGDPNPADVLARQVELVHAWRKFPAIDPALPRELLPPRWSGLQAAKLFADRHQRWREDARLEWKRLNSEG